MSEQQLVLMRMPLGPLGTNCYVIGDKAVGEAFIIDPATPEVLESLKKHDLKPKAVLLTHGHGDHIGGVQEIVDTYHGKNQYEHYAVNPKMKFPKKNQKDTIIYNDYITIRNIPAEAYDYVVNGKSAIEWLIERYAVTVDKKSGIRNDPNDWSREHENPSYIFDLVCSIVNVSIKTMQIVGKLPKLSFNGAEVSIDVAGRMSEISDSTKRELAIATEDNTLYLQVKHDDFYHIVVEERKDLVRTITESTASRYLAVNEQGTPLYNKQNVEEGKRYYLNDYNGGKFPYVAREFRYLKLVNGNASALIAINRINFKAENIKGNLAEWRVQLTLGEIIKVENYIIK